MFEGVECLKISTVSAKRCEYQSMDSCGVQTCIEHSKGDYCIEHKTLQGKRRNYMDDRDNFRETLLSILCATNSRIIVWTRGILQFLLSLIAHD